MKTIQDKLAEAHKQLGAIIRQERKLLKLTQTQLGELSGTGLNFISQLERGKESVQFDKLLAVLSVLGLELRLVRGKNVLADGREPR